MGPGGVGYGRVEIFLKMREGGGGVGLFGLKKCGGGSTIG